MVGDPPWMYQQKEEFFALPPAERAPHIWEALLFFQWAGLQPGADQLQVSQQTNLVCGLAQDVARELALQLGEEGACRDPQDPRWPRFHPESRDPLYLTGCHPPLLLCFPYEVQQHWKEVEFDASHKEMTAWLGTPAGMFGIPDEDRQYVDDATARYEEAVVNDRKTQARFKIETARLEKAREERLMLDALMGVAPPNLKPPRKSD